MMIKSKSDVLNRAEQVNGTKFKVENESLKTNSENISKPDRFFNVPEIFILGGDQQLSLNLENYTKLFGPQVFF